MGTMQSEIDMMKRWLGIPLILLGLGGCFGDENSDLKEWMRQNSEGLQGKVEPLPEVKTYEPFAYAAQELADPFRPAKMEFSKKGVSCR